MRPGSVLARSRIVYPRGLELPSCLYGLRLSSSSLSPWPGAEAASPPRTWPSWATTTHRNRSTPRSRPRTRARPTSPSRARGAATSRRPSSSRRTRKRESGIRPRCTPIRTASPGRCTTERRSTSRNAESRYSSSTGRCPGWTLPRRTCSIPCTPRTRSGRMCATTSSISEGRSTTSRGETTSMTRSPWSARSTVPSRSVVSRRSTTASTRSSCRQCEPSRYWAKELVPQETFESFHELLRDFDPVRLLGSFDGDVLIQNPRRDDDWPLREYERLAEDADGAEVKWYPDYGHEMGPEADTDRQEWLAQKLTRR